MKTVLRCVIFENLVIDISLVIVALVAFDTLRRDWIAFFVVSSWVLLLVVAITGLFIDRLLARRAFLVVGINLAVGFLFPAL